MKCQQILLGLSFSGCAILYAMRVNLSLAIVAMVVSPTKQDETNSFEYDCPDGKAATDLSQKMSREADGEFLWNERTQGKILGSFFYGYLFTNILGGRLSEIIGGKIVFGSGVGLTGLLSLFAPLAAKHSVDAFLLLRFLQGMTEGVTYPSLCTLMAQWVPPSDRSRFISRALGGSLFGTVVTLSSSGWLIMRWGWPSVFYVSGMLGLVWSLLWFCCVYDSPASHPTISKEEKEHLGMAMNQSPVTLRPPVPWKAIMTSPPFLALVFAHFGSNWGFYALLTELPTYLSTVHHFNMRDNGFVSAMPYLCTWAFSLFYSNYVDGVLQQGRVSFRFVRRNSTLIALLSPMVSLILVSEMGCRSGLVVLLISLGLALSGASYSGFHCGFQELAPNYAGTLMGISNTIATMPGVLAPLVTGIIINEQPTIDRWRLVFQLGSFIYLFTAFFYTRFMSVEMQPWNSHCAKHEGSKGQVKKV